MSISPACNLNRITLQNNQKAVQAGYAPVYWAAFCFGIQRDLLKEQFLRLHCICIASLASGHVRALQRFALRRKEVARSAVRATSFQTISNMEVRGDYLYNEG